MTPEEQRKIDLALLAEKQASVRKQMEARLAALHADRERLQPKSAGTPSKFVKAARPMQQRKGRG